ncbi:Ectonucleoside triphosphate diphosphohydrolase 5 [Chionoecetes opilio]|uniref:Ectonucleoside triphosphate diphosphohydrolase 5 n=1 Tax=Chionoecetes opilio TaxID=41210 RepID=A0A8J4YP57_CHIOP|nr:Ectonucleoside triphosphate diphosphohydrolase 5 [Chionoecetes opilio]
MRWLLLPLLRRARSVVPEPYLPYTPLLLRATPSLRRLPRPYASRLIYRARKIVSRTSFLVKREEVTIMAGHDEAADLWLAANFLTGKCLKGSCRLYQNDSLPMATANLGGGTLQVTIPLPGQPEHITRAINQRRKGGGGEVICRRLRHRRHIAYVITIVGVVVIVVVIIIVVVIVTKGRRMAEEGDQPKRRRRSVSKLAWETKAKVKAKRQNLLVALSQRCGRTGAGLLRSCGEPEIKCQPGEGGTSQAEMGHGKCDHLNLGGNQSSLAEQESPAGKDLIPKRYLQQNGDTALVRVTDGRGREGGGYQRRRRELRNLPETPNITYRCSPSHKYWLFASSMPMGLYPLRVKILQSGNITRAVPTSEDDSRPRRPTSETAPTTQSPPISVTQHHRSDIPPEEEYIGIDEVEDSSQYPGKLFTPSTIPQTHPTTAVPPSLPSTTQQPPPPPRPPYTTVRVTNKWVEETLAKVKTVVDSILKSIGSARSKNDNNASGSNDAPASKQTISSVTDLLFTVPNERVIRPAQNSKVQSEIKSTEKLIRTSLEGLLFRVPPGGPSSTIKQSQEVKSRFRASGGDVVTPTTTTASPDATTPHPEVTSPEDPPTGVDVKTIVTESEPAHRRSHERGKKIPGAEAPHDTNNQRLNATENGSREPESAEEEEEEEEGDLILRTACLPVGSIGRFKVEGVTYLVTGIGAGPGAEDCRREVTNVVNRHIRLPALNHTTLLATTAFYFVAASANLIEPEMTYGFVRVEQFRLAANIMCAKEPRLLPDPLACLDYQYIAALLTQGLHLSDDSEVLSPPIGRQLYTLCVHLLDVRDSGRENVPHPGDAAHKGALVLAGTERGTSTASPLVCDKIQGFRVSWALGAALDYLQNH